MSSAAPSLARRGPPSQLTSMGIRETLNRKRGLSAALAALLILFSGGLLAYTQWPQSRPKGDKAYFTVDDGQTWFLDSIYKVPPFDYNGQTAVRAMVYSYDNGSKKFCGYLMRYTSEVKNKLDAAVAQAQADGKPLSSITLFSSRDVGMNGVEIKLPGQTNWVPRSHTQDAIKVLDQLKSPDGTDMDLLMP
jgi:hypothetical protein